MNLTSDLPPFDYKIIMDEQGVLLSTLSGTFDVEIWKVKREEAIARDLAGVDLNGRPIIVDIRAVVPSASAWIQQADEVKRHMTEREVVFSRNAIVTGGVPDAEIMARFFIEYMLGRYKVTTEMKAFARFDDAYAWVTELGVPGPNRR